jgi:3-deoxy-D-manno-oct-2-ulosonic acid (Kdo) hydroxylase
MSQLSPYDLSDWQQSLPDQQQQQTIKEIEQGQVLYFPQLAFPFKAGEEIIFSGTLADSKVKNISYIPDTGRLKGVQKNAEALTAIVTTVMQRYADLTQDLVWNLFPEYKSRLSRGRTSLRAVEIDGRPSSLEKDDTRLHVDSFPSTPTHGERILRVFNNINPNAVTRNWRLGEPFAAYAQKFAPLVRQPLPGTSSLLNMLGITKSKRSLYDHYMLALHDLGKADNDYQQHGTAEKFNFPSGSTWLCFTDQVLHGVLSGQYMLEQTFYLPVPAMHKPDISPLRVLEKITERNLINAN